MWLQVNLGVLQVTVLFRIRRAMLVNGLIYDYKT